MQQQDVLVAPQASVWLAEHDAVMAELVARHGAFRIELRTDYYYALVSSIVGQQLSVKAAAAIKRRLVELFGGKLLTPEQILATDADSLRGIGFSRAKVAYIRDLAQHVLDGRLELARLPGLSNDDIIRELTAVKGIGEWTAHMFLMFALGRLDVLPVGDLGLRSGVRRQYGLADVPTPAQVAELAQAHHWHPYESVATWYLWRSLDNEPA